MRGKSAAETREITPANTARELRICIFAGVVRFEELGVVWSRSERVSVGNESEEIEVLT